MLKIDVASYACPQEEEHSNDGSKNVYISLKHFHFSSQTQLKLVVLTSLLAGGCKICYQETEVRNEAGTFRVSLNLT